MLLEMPLHCLSFWFSSSWLNLPVPLCMQILRWLFWPFEHFSRRRRWFLVHISSRAPWKLLTTVSLSPLSRLAVTTVSPKSLPTLSVPTLDFQRHSVCRLHQAVPEWNKLIVIDAKIVWGAINYLWGSTLNCSQLSNLEWIPNSVSIGFGNPMWAGSSRPLKRCPTTHRWVSSHLPLSVDWGLSWFILIHCT